MNAGLLPDSALVADVMVCALAAQITDGDVLGVGLGTPLAVLAGLLARATTAPRSHLLVAGAVDPVADLATVLGGPVAMAGHTAGFVSHLDTMGMAERQTMTLQFLRPAQVDAEGSLNTSRLGPAVAPAVRFPGGLATADVPSLLPRVAAYLPVHSMRNLPARLGCVTGSGSGADTLPRAAGVVSLVTDLAVFRFVEHRPVLASVHAWSSIRDVEAVTGFPVATEATAVTPLPSAEQSAVLAALDPGRRRCLEVTRSRPSRQGKA